MALKSTCPKRGLASFFKYARKRHEIYQRRRHGFPKPWTKDEILQKYRFTNVFRELDKTTVWFADNVRDPMDGARDPRLILATVVFRMLNRIESGEAMFRDDDLLGGFSAFDKFSQGGDVRHLKRALHNRLGKKGPFVTGAYIISSPTGMKKLDGMLQVIGKFYKAHKEWDGLGAGILDTMNWGGEEGVTAMLAACPREFTLESTWHWFCKHDYFGTFHSYEIVTDLAHTHLLRQAPDRMRWANPGPGCKRGLNRVLGREKDAKFEGGREEILNYMADILRHTKVDAYWPQQKINTKDLWLYDHDWPTWEMRDVEHTLCEFDKYERTRLGEGRPRGVFA
jgi:hypothetical protein